MFSKELEQSIANLFDQAQDKNLEYLTIEHLLLMLITDYEVRQALETNDVNIATLRENLEDMFVIILLQKLIQKNQFSQL